MSKQRTSPLLIGLAGGPGAGKDTAGGLLASAHNFYPHAFADSLRDFVYTIDPGWAKAFDVNGYENAKANVEGFRERLVEVGNAAREWISQDIWIDALEARMAAALGNGFSVVVTDVRYPNEATRIQSYGGIIVGIDRDGHLPETDHAEYVLANADEYVFNNGGMTALLEQLDEIVWMLADA